MNGMYQSLVNILRILGVILVMIIAQSSYAQTFGELNQLKGIDFRLNTEREAVIVIELAQTSSVVDLHKTDQGLKIELLKTTAEDDLLYLIDVQDFATEVKMIDVSLQQDSTVLLAEISAPFHYDYQLKGTFIEVTIKPLSVPAVALPAPVLEQHAQLMSINFQDIPVRNVLQLIADYNNFNLVVSDTVTGNLTLRLDGVPWQQVLDIILQVRGLDKRVDGNVILVAPKTELDLREQQQLEKARMTEALGDLKSEIIKISFAKASDIAAMIGGADSVNMLSERGSIRVDERTNALLIRELPENIQVIRDIIASLDIPVKQVQIEARIVTVNEGNLDELGVRWGVTKTSGNNTVGGSIESNLEQVGLYEPADGAEMINNFLNVNLGATSANASSVAFQVAKLGSGTLLDLELSAMQRESKAEIISSPRLITTNKQPAYIEQGTEIPYLESSSSGATTVAFKKAVLSLMVTPQITPDNRLVLDLNVTQDRPGDIVKTGTGEAVAIHTQRIGTQVLVNNGETVVLGGIFQHNITNTTEKVPLLGDLPLLGALFRRNYQQMGKSELLIFVTPKVVI